MCDDVLASITYTSPYIHTLPLKDIDGKTGSQDSLEEALMTVDQATVRSKIQSYATNGARLLAQATAKIVSRSLAWSFLGLIFAVATILLLNNFGLITIVIGDWNPWLFKVLLALLYAVVGVGIMGYVGMFRGIGRTMIFIGIEHGLVFFLLDNILTKITDTIEDKTTTTQVNWENTLHATIERYITQPNEDELGKVGGIKGKLARLVRTIICRQIEVFLKVVGKEQASASGSAPKVDIERVREVAFERAETFFQSFIEDMMNRYLLFGALAVGVLFAIAPLIIAVTSKI